MLDGRAIVVDGFHREIIIRVPYVRMAVPNLAQYWSSNVFCMRDAQLYTSSLQPSFLNLRDVF